MDRRFGSASRWITRDTVLDTFVPLAAVVGGALRYRKLGSDPKKLRRRSRGTALAALAGGALALAAARGGPGTRPFAPDEPAGRDGNAATGRSAVSDGTPATDDRPDANDGPALDEDAQHTLQRIRDRMRSMRRAQLVSMARAVLVAATVEVLIGRRERLSPKRSLVLAVVPGIALVASRMLLRADRRSHQPGGAR